MDGGALSWDKAVDLERTIDHLLAVGRGRMIASGSVGVVIQVIAPDRLPFVDVAHRFRVREIVMKVIPLENLVTPGIDLKGVNESEVREEFEKQKWLGNACVRKYGFSIFPTPILYQFTTLYGLASKFPFFGTLLESWRAERDCPVGVIFMEMVNSSGRTMESSRNHRANPLGRRLLFMLATLGFVHGDFHKGNFFECGKGFIIGDLGEARELTSKEEGVLTAESSSKRDLINVLYGRHNPMRDFTSQYYHPKRGDSKFNGYVKNYQWVRTDAAQLSTAIDDVEFASVREVKRSLGYRDRTRRSR